MERARQRGRVLGGDRGVQLSGKPLNAAQNTALAALIGELKYIYKIADHNVLAHSNVAYGAPNEWQKRSHRGRKRCGMLFMTSTVRARLGLKARVAYDPDVRAGRWLWGMLIWRRG